MKKIILGAVLLLLLFAGCGAEPEPASDSHGHEHDHSADAEPAESEKFQLCLKVLTESSVYGIHYEYKLGEEQVGGSVFASRSGTPSEQGKELILDFEARRFPDSADLSAFNVEIYVLTAPLTGEYNPAEDHSDIEKPCEEPVKIAAEYGQTYYAELRGSETDGFQAVLLENT